MKKMIMFFAAFLLLMVFLSVAAFAQNNNITQGKSYMKMKTMKIENGDTIVTEKEYSGDGNMDIEDSITDNGFGNFHFNMFNGAADSSFFKNFSGMENMQNMFKDFNLGMNENFFENFNFPEFNKSFDVDSIIKEFNFNDSNSYFPSLRNNKMIIKSFKDDDSETADSTDKTKPGMDIQIFGKDENGNQITYNKKITIRDYTDNSSKNNDNEIQVDVFPNPSDNYFNVSFQLDPKNKTIITINDINGKQLQKEIIDKESGLYTRQFDMKDFSKGVYFINIKQGKNVVSKQIIIE